FSNRALTTVRPWPVGRSSCIAMRGRSDCRLFPGDPDRSFSRNTSILPEQLAPLRETSPRYAAPRADESFHEHRNRPERQRYLNTKRLRKDMPYDATND